MVRETRATRGVLCESDQIATNGSLLNYRKGARGPFCPPLYLLLQRPARLKPSRATQGVRVPTSEQLTAIVWLEVYPRRSRHASYILKVLSYT